MKVCFNCITIVAPGDTHERLLQQGFSLSEVDDWGVSPQSFSFEPFIEATSLPDAIDKDELTDLWTNWIETKNTDAGECLTIEFESRERPPLAALNCMIEWLKQENLRFQLEFKYRLENQPWQGELRQQH